MWLRNIIKQLNSWNIIIYKCIGLHSLQSTGGILPQDGLPGRQILRRIWAGKKLSHVCSLQKEEVGLLSMSLWGVAADGCSFKNFWFCFQFWLPGGPLCLYRWGSANDLTGVMGTPPWVSVAFISISRSVCSRKHSQVQRFLIPPQNLLSAGPFHFS